MRVISVFLLTIPAMVSAAALYPRVMCCTCKVYAPNGGQCPSVVGELEAMKRWTKMPEEVETQELDERGLERRLLCCYSECYSRPSC
jgi:hypothetical protein